jgi:hypothetical protein
MTAVPADVNCAVPIIAEFSQWSAVASQKVIVPVVTAKLPAVTDAVKVTAVPEITEEVGLAFESCFCSASL